LHGWNAILDPEYISTLQEVLNVDLSGLDGSAQAFHVFNELYVQLNINHADGFWTNILLDDTSVHELGNPNREMWEMDTKRLGLTPPVIRELFGLDGKSSVVIYMDDLDFSSRCMDDAEDIIYLAESLGMVDSIDKNTNGSVYSATFLPEKEDEDLSVLLCDN